MDRRFDAVAALANRTEPAFVSAWRVIDTNGKSYGVFLDHEKACDFVSELKARLRGDELHICREVVPSGLETDLLYWMGDNIGLGGGDEPAVIGLMDSAGRRQFVSLEQALAVAERIDPASGYQRLWEALPSVAANGYLCPADLAAWRAAEHRIAALMHASAHDLDVTFWLVAEDRIEDGRRVSGVPLSPKFATEEQCREAAVEIKATKPDAYLISHTICFHWNRPEKFAFRNQLLGEIRRGELSHG